MESVLKVNARHCARIWAAIILLHVYLPPIGVAAAEKPERAKLKVSGYGILGNRDLKRALELLEVPKEKSAFYGAQFIEDAALILMARLTQDGFLNPKVAVRLTLNDGSAASYVWQHGVEQLLPRPLQAKRVQFSIEEGIRYVFEQIEFIGLETLTEKEARAFFIETGALLPVRRNRVYTPQGFQRGLANLTEALERRGFQGAKAAVLETRRNDKTGNVYVQVEVMEGPKSIVRSARQQVYLDNASAATVLGTAHPNQPYSQLWVQDFIQALKSTYYHRGYPDTTVEITTVEKETIDGVIYVDLLANIKTASQIRVGKVVFQGQKKTKESVLDRRVRLENGELLDRVAADEGRYRWARLGTFESVDLSYEPVDEQTRNVVYRLKEGKQTDVSLLFGYGSYELLRGGVELEQYNVFGRPHHSRLRLVQSFKSSSADYNYTMPEFLGKDLDVFLNASGLRREEISFRREEFGGGAGARRYFKPIETELSVRYNYQVLNAAEGDPTLEREGLREAGVGALITDVRHDRRDNPLYPHEGYKIFANIEIASDYLAGDANYQRLELFGSYHQPLDAGRWLHLGLSHGVVFSVADSAEDLPFNKRFFPGGESSVRGFQMGEAAPRNERGKIVGAECYFGGSIEFEQALTSAWSFVTFVDSVGFARRIEAYPLDEVLVSAGIGIRWKTMIGPIRLEYGHNLNPREDDPSGTLHFSIGFPF